MTTVWAVYFSGTGTTERTVTHIAGELARLLAAPCRSLDFTRPQVRQQELNFCQSDLVVLGTPVYAGRVPNVLLPFLREKVRGGGALAVPVVLFGNRNYDDALIELRDSLREKGYTFTYDDALVEHLVKSSYSAAYGARNLRRCIQKELEDPMAFQIIDSFEHPITQLRATAEDGKVRLDTL